jgi:uncharacterized protein (TIGR02466 family)
MIHQLFSKSILTADLGRDFSTQERSAFETAEYVLDSSSTAQEPTNISYTKEVNILNSLKLAELASFILKNVNDYMFNHFGVVDPVEFYITRSWFVKSEKGGFGRRHNHPNSVLSGVLYLQSDSESGNFILHDNQNTKFGSIEFSYGNINETNCSYVSIPPKPGMLILFPSNMMHEVGVNKSQQLRYSLSFDVWFKGPVGTGKSHTVLTD